MRLLDLLYKIDDDVTVWISTDSKDDSECIYFGETGEIPISVAKGYDVVELYPERYPAMFCTGITVIVKKEGE